MSVIRTNSKKIDTSTFWGMYEYLRVEKQMTHIKAFNTTKRIYDEIEQTKPKRKNNESK